MVNFDFKTSVIDRSAEVPVVVDFWAPWCGPCRILGPVIEELAEEADGTWELVKLNTEDEQQIAMEYGIRSIPNVKMFYQGEVIAEFAGALPKFQIQKWLEQHLPDARAGEYQEIINSLPANPGAVAKLREFVTANPDFIEARITLAGTQLFENPAEALVLVDDIRAGHPQYDQAEDIRMIAALADFESEEDMPVVQRLKAAREALVARDWDATLNYIVEALMYDKSFQDDLPRKAAIAIFHYLGEGHQLSKKYRPRFSMALY